MSIDRRLCKGFHFHVTSWLFHKSKRPVKTVLVAEILAASEAIDESKSFFLLIRRFSELIFVSISVWIPKIFTSLSTQRLSIDCSVRSDVTTIRFEFSVGNIDKLICLPAKSNLADVLTKMTVR